jgi:signal transduction histidine kinase
LRRWLPKSLVGQVTLLIALALLAAQAVNFALLLNEGQRARLAQSETPALSRLVGAAQALSAAPPAQRDTLARRLSGGGTRFNLAERSAVQRRGLTRDSALEQRFTAALKEAGVRPAAVMAGEAEPRRQRPDDQAAGARRLLITSVLLPDGSWLNGRLTLRRPDTGFAWRLLAATLALYAIVLGAVLLIARRLARPLAEMAAAAESFRGRDAGFQIRPHGPADLRRLAEAFNDMRARVVELLADKDRMIGAIGHDLRTPLASLRIRAESVPDEAERARMVATIEDLDQTLDDILALARAGQPSEAARAVDVAALVETVTDEFVDLGRDVAFETTERVVATIRPNSLKRAVRNLIENAIKYGEKARVGVTQEPGGTRILVEDEGPGIASAELDRVTDPFYRLEPSRSRLTGGSGLGLAIARTVAEAHGGRLELRNRPEGGLAASILLPASGTA